MIERRRNAMLVALAVLAVSGCGGAKGDKDDAAGDTAGAVVPVRVAKLEERAFADALTAPGQWRSGGELVISAPAAGVIEALTVTVGDRVEAGQTTGTLVPKSAWAALHGAELLAREAQGAEARADAERALALARRDLVRVPLVARQAGIVVRRTVEPGAEVADGVEVLALAPWATLVFEAHVPASDAKRVHAGQAATVRAPGAPPHAAHVTRVLPMASDADQASLVWLAPEGGTTPELGRFATAEITVGIAHHALAAPDSAIVEDDLTGERRIAAIDATGRLAWHGVRLGAAANGWRELVGSDLRAGDTVVIEGHRGLPDSTRVTSRP
ncbi:MAG: HlyD family efflux transporter periplasmic adaptor subunit [Candidatus Eisenbacteria bacterium]|nr:HlyD family efflux transporter periplasmic adaptor subunit [Candidatus Eisenbacteria bacterium]